MWSGGDRVFVRGRKLEGLVLNKVVQLYRAKIWIGEGLGQASGGLAVPARLDFNEVACFG